MNNSKTHGDRLRKRKGLARCGVALVFMTILTGVSRTGWADEPAPAQIAPEGAVTFGKQVAITYTVYSHWLPVMKVGTDFRLGENHYDVDLTARAQGLFSLFSNLNVESVAHGAISGERVTPSRYDSSGWSRHAQRHVIVDYPQGHPYLALQDPAEPDREKVAPALAQGAADILSTMTKILLQVRDTGKCDGTFDIFDGVRLTRFTLRTDGSDMRPDVFNEKKVSALRCAFSGYQVAGFIIGHQAKSLREPHGGMIWFESVAGFGPVPVRAEMEHPHVGHLTVQLEQIKNVPK